jgi:hypothetical protein
MIGPYDPRSAGDLRRTKKGSYYGDRVARSPAPAWWRWRALVTVAIALPAGAFLLAIGFLGPNGIAELFGVVSVTVATSALWFFFRTSTRTEAQGRDPR